MEYKIKFFRNINLLAHDTAPKIATIGNFDGVHAGHKLLLNKTLGHANKNNYKSVVITFYPHTKKVVTKQHIPNIFGLREKLMLFEELGFDYTIALRFSEKLKNIDPIIFFETVLLNNNIVGLVVGDDFSVGKDRTGNLQVLHNFAKENDILLDIINRKYEASSSLIKKYLMENDFVNAATYLEHKFYRIGRVVHGEKNGEKIGFQTANLRLFDKKPIISGVFLVFVSILDSDFPKVKYNGIANWGVRPTFEGIKQKLEVHIFDFNRDIYGKLLKIEFCIKIRDEKKFCSIDALKKQIEEDILIAKKILMKKNFCDNICQ